VLALRSPDHGASWSEPVELGRLPDAELPHDPEMPGLDRGNIRAPAIATAATAPGLTAVAWQSDTAYDAAEILVTRSTDGGATWSAPTAAVSLHAQAFTPELAAAPDGTLGLAWYDLHRDRRRDRALDATARFTHSHDGAATWSAPVPLGGTFDLRRSPPHRGYYLGVHQGLAALGNGAFTSVFVQAPPLAREGKSDVFVTRLRSPAERLRLRVRPSRVRAGARTRFMFLATIDQHKSSDPAEGVRIRFLGRTVRADRAGRAVIIARIPVPGRARARAFGPGLWPAVATVTAVS
jgi:hypothetical protein